MANDFALCCLWRWSMVEMDLRVLGEYVIPIAAIILVIVVQLWPPAEVRRR
jgi:hypothetical protein